MHSPGTPNIPTGHQTQTQWSSVTFGRNENLVTRVAELGPPTQPNPTPLFSASELQREDTAAPLTEQPAATATAQTPSWVNPCYPARLTLKPPGKVTREWESCQAVISQSKRKCCSLDISSCNAVHPPHSNFLYCSLVSALFVAHQTPIWECFKRGCPSDSVTWYFPGCWFCAQAGAFAVAPLRLDTALATARQVLQEGYKHMTLIHSFGKAEQALSPWVDSISLWSGRIILRDSALGWQINSFGICFFVNTQTWLITLM